MNISTYEARIAALEAQLGPEPGPTPETGLASVVVTPDITLSDGTSLNAKLAAMMPVAESSVNWIDYAAPSLTVGTKYTVRVTPGENWYAYPFEGNRPIAAQGPAGEAAELEFEVILDSHENILRMFAAVGPTVEPDTNTMVSLRFRVNSPNQ